MAEITNIVIDEDAEGNFKCSDYLKVEGADASDACQSESRNTRSGNSRFLGR